MIEDIRKDIENSPVILRGEYPYIVTPLMDGIPSVDPKIMKSMADKMSKIGKFNCDIILAPEAMGIPYATLISMKKGIPFTIIRKRSYGLECETEIVETTGYSTTKMYINGVRPGMKVVVVDDVVSTGGTLRCIVDGLRDMGAVVTEVVLALNKSRDIFSGEEEIGVPIRYVAKIWVENGKPRCIC
jgi:adenine phosphoribosyltransferase